MSYLWSIDAFVAAVGGRLEGDAPPGVAGISIDSRSIGPGDAFVAIRGENRDGHEFAAAALEKGAALALVEASRAPATGPLVVVPDDPLAALERLAAAARERMTGRVIAVTGSVGKTGTTAMLQLALSAIGPTHVPVGSFNNQWGVPLTLARMPAGAAFGIFEIGMNHPGEIRPLTKLVRPHAAIVTTVEAAHLEYFDSEEGIAEAKAEIFEGIESGGAAILNRDNRWFDLLAKQARARGARVVSFGEHQSSDMRLVDAALSEESSEIKATLFGKKVLWRLGAPGRHLVQNSLGVVAACDAVGADIGRVSAALSGFSAPKGRGARMALTHPHGEFTLIDESYNANPASMRAALAVLGRSRPTGSGRRIAVLGDMLELGAESPALHRALADAIEEADSGSVFLAGPMMRGLWEDLPEARRGAYAEKAAELEPILLEAIGPGDVIMMKASLGTRLGPLVEALKRKFPGARDDG